MIVELPEDWKQFSRNKLEELKPDIRDSAVQFLRGFFTEDIKAQIRDAEKSDPQTWWVEHHLWWGMGVRNTLRANGFGEEEFGVDNLDDYYIGLIEAAVL